MNGHRMNAKNPNLKAVHWNKNQLEKFAHDFAEIYNKAWANHGEGKQIEAKKVLKMFQTMKPILDENISWFIYENEKPIAMWINIPDLNQWLKYLNGKFGWIEKLKFLMVKFFYKKQENGWLSFRNCSKMAKKRHRWIYDLGKHKTFQKNQKLYRLRNAMDWRF